MTHTDGQALGIRYKHLFGDLAKLVTAETTVTEGNVYQEGNQQILKIVFNMIEENMLPGSGMSGMENFKEFYKQVKSGKRGLILMEHYSNFDLPGLICLLSNDSAEGKEIADSIVAIAGMKLTEENPIINAWASAFSRVIIYPSRSLASITDPVAYEKEEKRSRAINMASMRALDRVRKDGKIVLVFPSGTRYRKDKPETKKGVREIDSYLRLSDIMIPVAITGNCLRISDKDPSNMLADEVWSDKIVFTAGKPLDCKQFRNTVLESLDDSVEDKKQPVVDKVMNMLEELHNRSEKENA